MKRTNIVILMLSIVVVALTVRLYQTTRRLEKAEQYMMSGVVAWAGTCVAESMHLQSPNLTSALEARNFTTNHCVTEEERPTLEALFDEGRYREATLFVDERAFGRRLPRIVKRGTYDSSSFPVGYP